MTITYTAYITTEELGDPGLLIQASDLEDGMSHYQYDAARIDSPDFALGDEDGDLTGGAAEKILAMAGFTLASAGWGYGNGQYSATVEPAPDAKRASDVGDGNAAWLASQGADGFGQGNDHGIQADGSTVTLSPAAYAHMRGLPPHLDGCIDDRDVLWIEGTGYPVRVDGGRS